MFNGPMVHFRLLFVVLGQIHRRFCIWSSIHSENIAPIQGLFLTGAQYEPEPPKKMRAPKLFAAAPNTLHVGLLTSQRLVLWAP